MLGPVFTFGRRGGSKRNLVAISESINDARLAGVVRRHLHFHPVTDGKTNEAFAHLTGDVRENEMIVRERDTKHGPGQHRHNGALQFDGFFGIHNFVGGFRSCRGAVSFRRLAREVACAPYRQTDLPAITGKGTPPAAAAAAVRTRTFFARTRFVDS